MKRLRSPLRWMGMLALSATIAGLSASATLAGEFKVENYSNQPIFVALAFDQGETVSLGWFTIRPGDSRAFQTPDASPMFFRVEQALPEGGVRELTYNVPTSNFPALRARFEVKNAPDDPNVRFLRWGADLEMSMNMNRNDQLPDGWGLIRYHRVDQGNSKLEIKP